MTIRDQDGAWKTFSKTALAQESAIYARLL